jgi:hypothetical protein
MLKMGSLLKAQEKPIFFKIKQIIPDLSSQWVRRDTRKYVLAKRCNRQQQSALLFSTRF